MASKRKVDIPKLVEDLSANELKKFVLRLAKEDDYARDLLVSTFAPDAGGGRIAHLKKKVDAVVRNYGNNQGYIQWDESESLLYELDDMLQQQTETLIQAKQYKDAFDFVCYVFQTMGEVDTDDNECGFEIVAETCVKLWQEIIPHCPAEESKAMLQWFLDYPKAGYTVDYLQSYVEDIAITQFHDEAFLRQKLQELDRWIEQHSHAQPGKHGFSNNHSLRQKVLYRLHIMQKLEFPRAEVQEYRTRFHCFSEVRQQTIDDALAHGETEQALAVLQESKNINEDNRGDRSHFLPQLIALYKRLGRKDEYKKELIAYAFESPELETFMELKAVCGTKEWEGYRDQLLDAHSHSHVRLELLQAEGMYERLLQEVGKSSSLYALQQYEECLKAHFPEQVRDIYARHAQKEIRQADSRSSYQRAVGYLQHIRPFPDGAATAQAIADEWKATYRLRRALLDELRKAGF